MAPHALVLYILLPSLAAGIAGYTWGEAILDPARVQNYGQSMLRGFFVGAGTFAIFAALYACSLPMLEGQWSLVRVGSLFPMTLILGVPIGGPLFAAGGMTAAASLFKLSRHFIAEK
jgi:formate/nitrite transporter FocA (FNT family)